MIDFIEVKLYPRVTRNLYRRVIFKILLTLRRMNKTINCVQLGNPHTGLRETQKVQARRSSTPLLKFPFSERNCGGTVSVCVVWPEPAHRQTGVMLISLRHTATINLGELARSPRQRVPWPHFMARVTMMAVISISLIKLSLLNK